MALPIPDIVRRPWSVVTNGFFEDVWEDTHDVFDELIGDGAGLVEDGGELLHELVEEGTDLIEDVLGVHRRVCEGDGHAEIEVRGINQPEAREMRSGLKRSLERLDGVQWAEVNAITNRVAVGFDGARSPLGALLGVVDGIEDLYGVRRERLDERRGSAFWETDDRADHPADVEPVHRVVAALVGDTVGLGASVLGRMARLPRIPIELGSIASLVENQPWLRDQVERRIGKRATDTVLPLTQAMVNGIAQGPGGIVVDLAHHLSLFDEVAARRDVWRRREPELYAEHPDGLVEPPSLDPRPRPLPAGPVEVWAQRIAFLSLAAFVAALPVHRDPRRAADAFVAGVPKAGRLGREGFATRLGRVLADRGIVPLDASSLRRLDRVDTVVLDSATLLTGRSALEAVVPLGDLDADRVRGLGERLFDPTDVMGSRTADGWTLAPLDVVAETATVPRGGKTRGRELRAGGGVPLALSRDGTVEALLSASAELDPAAHVLVAAVRQAGHRLVVAGRNGRADKLVGADEVVPSGRRMGAAIRELQARGAVVAAVVRRGTTGLAAADVGINVARSSGRPSWGADLLCGRELAEAALLVHASAVARRVSVRSARMAAAGSAVGTAAAMTGPRWGAGRRALLAVNAAAGLALLSGMWSGAGLHGVPAGDAQGGQPSSAAARSARDSRKYAPRAAATEANTTTE